MLGPQSATQGKTCIYYFSRGELPGITLAGKRRATDQAAVYDLLGLRTC